jgi:hypothetical protein
VSNGSSGVARSWFVPVLAAGHRQQPLYSATGGRSRNGPNAKIVANGARAAGKRFIARLPFTGGANAIR